MQTKDQKLADILSNASKLLWRGSLYCEDVPSFSANTKCIILNDGRGGGEATFAKENNFRFTLSVQTVKGIVDDARRQRPDPTGEDLINAFNFYLGHETFINFPKS